MTGLVRLIAFTLAAMPLPPAAAQTPATRFDADYTGKLAGPVSGQLSFKAVNGTLVGTADGTVDGRSFHGKLEGHVGDGASPALTATITGTVAAKQAATSGGGGGGTFPAEPFNRLQVTYSISGIPLGTPKDEAGFTHTRTYPVTGPSSGVIKITGKSAPFKATCNSEYGSFWFETKAVLTVGERKAPFSTKAPCDKPAGTPTYTVEQPAAEFEVMLSDVKPNEDVSFSITEVFVNPRFGNRGVMISGSRGADGGEDILTLTLEGKPVGKLASTTRTVRFEGTAKANFAGTALDGTFTAAGSPCPTTRRPDGSCPEALAQVCPSAAGGFAATGLIAAANDANAVVRYQGAPNATVRIVADHDLTGIPKTAAEVRLSVQRPDTSGKRWIEDLPDIEAQTDASGQLDVDVKLRVQNGAYTYHDAIARPGRITVRFSETDGRSAKETARVPIDVGLGAVVEVAKMASLPADDSGQARHAWRAYVKSAFHPGLDLAGYVAELSKCPLPIAVPRVAMHSWWSNDDGSGEPLNDGVGGRSVGLMQQNTDFWGSHGAVLDLARAKNGRTYLAPHDSRPPAASFDGDRLPAIAQSRDGHFVKAYFGYLIAGTDTNVASVEPRVLDRAIYVLSHESSESVATSLACALEPRDGLQVATLLFTSWVPVAGPISKGAQDWAAIACKLARADYRGLIEELVQDKAQEKVLDVIKSRVLSKLTRQLVDGQDVPPIVFTIAGVEPGAMNARSAAYKKWLAAFSDAVDKAAEAGKAGAWSPEPSGAPTAAPKVPPSAGYGAQDAQDALRGGGGNRSGGRSPAPTAPGGSSPAPGGPMPGMKW